jgi:endoglucanase
MVWALHLFERCFLSAAIFMVLPVSMASPPEAEEGNAFIQAHRLGRGVNILGWDPMWKDPAAARFKLRLFNVIREGGFQTVRGNPQKR